MFPCGVASGDPTSSSVVLWTKVAGTAAGADRTVAWEVSSGERVIARGDALARADDDHTVHVDVTDLDPGEEYEYRFTVDGATVVGRTRTLPAAADSLRFAVMCCHRWGWPGFDRAAAVADERPDVVLHLGDSIYEIGEVPPAGPATEPRWDCHTLADYRQRYRQHRSHPALRRLHADVPVIAVWDDHEVVDNAPDPAQADRRRAGQRAWWEWTPMRRERDDASVNRFVTVDGLIDLALVDSRFSGRLPSQVDGPGDPGDGAGHLLAPDQWRLLDEFVRGADAPWLAVANQVQVGPTTLTPRPALAWPPWRRVVNPDQWDGYPGDRDRLFHLLDQSTGDAVVLSGDLHSAWSRTLSHHRKHVGHEFTSPSISGSTFAEAVRGTVPLPTSVLTAWLRLINRGVDHLDLDRHGYVVCDVTPERLVTTFVMHDGERHEISLSHR